MQRPGVQDRADILDLHARYSWALDTGDTDGYCALVTADAEATEETRDGGIEVRRGRDEIRSEDIMGWAGAVLSRFAAG